MSFDGIFTKAVVDEIYPLLLNGKINKINQPDKKRNKYTDLQQGKL